MVAATLVRDVGEKEVIARNWALGLNRHLTSHLSQGNKASTPCLRYKMGIIKGYSTCNPPVAA